MKKYLFSIVLFLIILVSPAVAQQAKAATLTSSQINAIVSLLRAFGADESVISNVEISLNGNTSTTPSITVLSPNGGEVWQTGQTHTVTWNTSNPPAGTTIGLQLSYQPADGITYEDVITIPNLNNTGSYQWTIPSKFGVNMNSNTFKMRAIVYGYTETNPPQDYSDSYFTITASTAAAVNGSCGSANGNTSSYSSAPSSNLCSAGTASSVTAGTNSYTWTCAGSNGGATASCSANKTSSTVSCASTHYGCNNGLSYNNVSGTSSYTWTCTDSGFSPATSVSCSEAKTSSTSAPYCSIYFSPSAGIYSGQYANVAWFSQNDTDGQLPFSCTGNIGSGQVAASGSVYGPVTQTQTCSLTAVNPQGGSYTCSATINVATNTASTAVNGSCGSANGNTSSYSSAPSSNLCSAGTASSVTAGTNSYTWTCAGSNGGATASCSANKTSSTVSCASTHYGCNNGLSYNNVSGTSSYTWTCTDSGFSPATSVSCSEAKTSSTAAPTCNVSFSPTSISTGGSSTVTWSSSSNASELSYVCSGPINGSGAAALSGSNSYTFNSAGTETCTITVKNSAGQTGTCSESLGVSSPSTTSNATQMQNGQQYSGSASSDNPAKYYFTLDSDVNRAIVQITTTDWTGNADTIVSSIAQPTCNDFGKTGYYSNVTDDSNENVTIRQSVYPSQSFSSGTKFYVTLCAGSSVTANFRVFYNAYMAATASATSNKQIAGVFGAVEELVLGNTAQEQRSIFKHVWNRDLQIGSPYAEDIKALQTALAKESVYAGDITGGFYNQTFVGVKNFQKKYGIEQTGFVGPITRSKLNTIYSD